jgi:hypothetical protein
MSAGWVAGSVRARALARRRLGPLYARRLAALESLPDAQRVLAGTAYGRRIRPGQDLAATQHEVAAALLWDLRVLAGWLPPQGLPMLRVLAAWFEIANVDELLAGLGGVASGPQFDMGALATAWPRLRHCRGLPELRLELGASAWRDPGGEDAAAIRLGMRARWAEWLAGLGEPVRSWTAQARALLPGGRVLGPPTGPRPVRAGPVATGRGPAANGPRDGSPSQPDDAWRAELALRARVEQDGLALLRTSSLDRDVVLGTVAVLACDAWRTVAALEVAARGGNQPGRGLEVFDELA